MKKQRNQPDRLPFLDRFSIRLVAGVCPSCAYDISNMMDIKLGVIYRRSNHSVTFRCNHCSLQWTVTLANLHRVAKRKAAAAKADACGSDDPAAIGLAAATMVARGTAFAAEHEAARRTAIKRQLNRRVIRLPDWHTTEP
jgi:hypothetical protein